MKHLLLLIAFLFCGPALAQTTEYVCDCATGAHASCVAGSSGNNGTSSSTPKQNISQLSVALNDKAAGSTVRFCEGGAWSWSYISIENMNTTATSRLTLESYAPPTGATGKPILRASGTGDAVSFGSFLGAGATDDKGYVFRNLHFHGNGTGGTGFQVWGTVSNILWDNVSITNWTGNGIEFGEPTGRDFIFRDGVISDNDTNGILGCGDDLVVEGNTFENNNTDGGTQEHAFYIASSGHECKRAIIRGNTFTNNSSPAGTCDGGNITAHGMYDQLVIERNVITVAASTDACGGIYLTSGYGSQEYWRRARIDGNTIVNVGLTAITVHSATNPVIQNNRIISTLTSQMYGINVLTDSGGNPEDDASSGAVIRNNTCYFSQVGTGSPCIQVDSSAGTGITVTNNLAYYGSSASSGSYCWVYPALSNFTAWNYNHCYRAAGTGTWSSTHTALSNAQAAGYDTNGLNSDPQITTPSSGNSWSLALTSTSPGRVAGSNTYKAPFDVLRCRRSTTPSIGAHEYNGSPCLTIKAPVGVR